MSSVSGFSFAAQASVMERNLTRYTVIVGVIFFLTSMALGWRLELGVGSGRRRRPPSPRLAARASGHGSARQHETRGDRRNGYRSDTRSGTESRRWRARSSGRSRSTLFASGDPRRSSCRDRHEHQRKLEHDVDTRIGGAPRQSRLGAGGPRPGPRGLWRRRYPGGHRRRCAPSRAAPTTTRWAPSRPASSRSTLKETRASRSPTRSSGVS